MKTQFTKGPWKAELHDGKYEVWSVTEFVASIPESIVTDKKANAHLIAAAPEMLEALEKIEKTLLEKHQGIENHTYELLLISDAIIKARGET